MVAQSAKLPDADRQLLTVPPPGCGSSSKPGCACDSARSLQSNAAGSADPTGNSQRHCLMPPTMITLGCFPRGAINASFFGTTAGVGFHYGFIDIVIFSRCRYPRYCSGACIRRNIQPWLQSEPCSLEYDDLTADTIADISLTGSKGRKERTMGVKASVHQASQLRMPGLLDRHDAPYGDLVFEIQTQAGSRNSSAQYHRFAEPDALRLTVRMSSPANFVF